MSITDATVSVKKYPNLAFLADDVLVGGVDLVLGGALQLYEDSFDPRFTTSQRSKRAIVAAGGNVFIGISASVFATSTACASTGPACPFIAISAGIGAGIGFDEWVKPVLFQIIPGISPVDNLRRYNQ